MSGVRTGRVDRHRRLRVDKASVVRMMAVMDGKSEDVKEFLETGRTGRRNAMPDILHPQGSEVTTADLPLKLEQLATTDAPDLLQPGPSKEEAKPEAEESPKTGS